MQQRNAEQIRFQAFCWRVAVDNRLETVGPPVMAVALIGSGPNSVTKLLSVMGVNVESLSSSLSVLLKESMPRRRPKTVDHDAVSLSEGGKEIMRIAGEVCELIGDPAIGPHHVLMAILKHDRIIASVFDRHGVTFTRFRAVVKESLQVEQQPPQQGAESQRKERVAEGGRPGTTAQPAKQGVNEKDILTRYCRNLTLLASQGKLDPVIGRDREISRLAMTLGRRKKNNAILVGEPGVGKTAVVEGLAQRIVRGEVPSHAKSCQVFQLNMTAVVSKTTYRGQFEERMRAIMELFAANRDYVLFIDEMHTLIGAGGSIGGLDAANIMKPALASGDVRCVGATTEDEYRRYFKKDGALDRRFQRIFIDEPSKEEAIRILLGIKPVIESHHKCVVPDDVVRLAVELSLRHVPDRRLPDKAIDCLDEACASAASAPASSATPTVSKDDVVAAIAFQTDMPKEIVGSSDASKAKSLSAFLRGRVVGQDAAIDCISSVLLGAYVGIRDPRRPIGCLVFGGPSGSGTTFVAEKMAEGLFDSDASFVRINISEFSEKFGNTRLIGSPPGYVGYGDRNQLTDRVARRPYCLILLDGIENASEDVVRLFMQAMSKGVITDAAGHDVSFRNAVIVMTITFRASAKASRLGFGEAGSGESDAKRAALMEECRRRFGDDFVNRVDEFVVFGDLGPSDIRRAAEMRLLDLEERLKAVGTSLSHSDDVVDAVVAGAARGGRQPTVKDVDRFVRKDVEPEVSRVMAAGDPPLPCLVLEVVDGDVMCSACQEPVECEHRKDP